MLDARVADRHNGRRRVERNLGCLQRAAIDQKRVILLPHDGDELIHDADLRADVIVLRRLGRERQFFRVDFGAGKREEGKPGRDFERGRR